jgi:ribosomal protein L29
MELSKLNADTLRNYEISKLSEVELDIRTEMLRLRMDIYTEKGKNSAKMTGLKRGLARTLTIRKEKSRHNKKD